MHPDPRSGFGERSSQLCSDDLLSVQDVKILHLMLHAREAHWQTPVIGAPHLNGRSLFCSDPGLSRARRPLIMIMRSLPSGMSVRGCQALPQAAAGLSVAPAGISPYCR